MQHSRLFVLGFAFLLGAGCKAHAPEAAPEAAAEAAPAPEAKPAPPAFKDGEGQLRVNSLPWSNMVINGNPAGRSGQPVTLKAGVHTVALTTSDGKTHAMKVTVEGGQVTKVCWDFDKEKLCER